MKDENYDAFINNSIYPDPLTIFNSQLRPIDEIKDDCFFVLDTNVLLVPYLTGSNSLNEIKKVFKKLKDKKSLVVPGQVAREFANNRPEKLKELFQQLNRRQNSIPNLETGKYPLLEDIDDYKKVIDLENAINKQLTNYRKLVNSLVEKVRRWNWDDPVSLMYREIFTKDIVLDIKLDKEKISEDLRNRYKHKIPPGYKDTNKPDDGIGDLLIWLTILELGKQKKHVVFISGDEKADWFHKSEKIALYPRFELVNEFCLISEGKSFHIAKLSTLLDLFGADEKAVVEVASEELFQNAIDARPVQYEVLKAVYYWLQTKYNNVNPLSAGSRLDFVVEHAGSKIGVSVLPLFSIESILSVDERLTQLISSEVVSLTNRRADKFQVVIVSQRDEKLFQRLESIVSIITKDFAAFADKFEIFYGFVVGSVFIQAI